MENFVPPVPKPKVPLPNATTRTEHPAEPLAIDGAYGEGGGQVLRNSFAYSAILRQPIDVTDIRYVLQGLGTSICTFDKVSFKVVPETIIPSHVCYAIGLQQRRGWL